MAFQLGRREHVVEGIRRVVIEELRAARKNLNESSPSNEAKIHAARKSIKKVRAILAAIDAAGGRGTTRSGKRLRDVNRVLSPLRDLDAMSKTLAKLREIYPTMFSEHVFGRIRRNLLTQRQRALESTRARGLWKLVKRELQRLPREVPTWRTPTRGFRLLAKGIRVAQRDGRRLLECARVSERATDFHAWRKQVKKLWYLLRLLEWAGPGVRRDVKALGRAEEYLGVAHDIGTLSTELSMDPDLFASDTDRWRFRRALDDVRVGLHVKAISSTKRIFRQKSRRYVQKVESVWRDGRSQAAPKTAKNQPQRKLA
jgi:CHAD domain-containing protein